MIKELLFENFLNKSIKIGILTFQKNNQNLNGI